MEDENAGSLCQSIQILVVGSTFRGFLKSRVAKTIVELSVPYQVGGL